MSSPSPVAASDATITRLSKLLVTIIVILILNVLLLIWLLFATMRGPRVVQRF